MKPTGLQPSSSFPKATDKRNFPVFFLTAAVFILISCASPPKGLFPPRPGEPTKPVYVVNNGWHASFVVKREDIPVEAWPEKTDFPEAIYLEIGWGDKDYYMTPGFNLWYAFKALFWPTASVLHIVGFSDPLEVFFPESEIIEIPLSLPGFEQLCKTVHDSYRHDEKAHPIVAGPGLYGESRFYLSNEKYHLFKTSNVWTAKALRSAGVPVRPLFSITAGGAASQARTFGRTDTTTPSMSPEENRNRLLR
jgi:uncharacterized protein (TIGR02117 family)